MLVADRTVVVITHEEEVAAFAKRIIRLRDGLVVDDRRRAPAFGLPPALAGEAATLLGTAG